MAASAACGDWTSITIPIKYPQKNHTHDSPGYSCDKYNKNSSGDEIANVLVNDDIAHT